MLCQKEREFPDLVGGVSLFPVTNGIRTVGGVSLFSVTNDLRVVVFAFEHV